MTALQSDLVLRQGYIDGAWVDADSGATFAVTNPAFGEVVAEVPRMGGAETRRAIEAAQRALPGWRGMLAKERAAIMRRWADLMMDHQEDLAALLTTEQGKPLAESRVEIAYAASFLEWFGEEAKRVYGDTIPTYMRDRRIVVAKEAGGRDRRHHALELPGRHADAQGRAGAGRRLHDGAQAGRADAAQRAGRHAPGRGGRPAARGAEHRHRRRRGRAGHRARDDLQPDRAQARLHRLDRGRQAAHGPVRRADQEGLARAGRQRAVHRLRRRRPRGRRRRGADLQVPQLGPDLHLGQPDPRAGRDLRRLPGGLHRGRDAARRGRRLHRERQRRAAHRPAGHREGPAPRGRRARARRRAAARRRAPRAGGAVLRADGDDGHHRRRWR